MSATTVFLIAILIVLVFVLALLLLRRRSARLRSHFGPEYARVVDGAGGRRKAEAELRERARRVSRFDIRPLSMAERDRFAGQWTAVQAEFVDEPKTALARADDLITDVMKARGYPMEAFERRSADLSVDHPSVVQNYRAGRDIALRHQRGEASTEDLRQAMIHYRALFDELVAEIEEIPQRRAS
jgi:hypothetical protein